VCCLGKRKLAAKAFANIKMPANLYIENWRGTTELRLLRRRRGSSEISLRFIDLRIGNMEMP
jgi:hypothetical protein